MRLPRSTVPVIVVSVLAALAAAVGLPGQAAAQPDVADIPVIGDIAQIFDRPADPFYTPPPGFEQRPLGSLLRVDSLSAPIVARESPGTQGFRILYVTTGARGEITTASASLFVPPGQPSAGERALVAVGVADESLGAYCHPSSTLASSLPSNEMNNAGPVATAAKVLDRGNAVLIADLSNNGGVAPHPALVPQFNGTALLDGLRAARWVGDAELRADSPIGIFGPSGGGSGAAAASAEMAPTYAPELNLPAILIGQIIPDHRNFIKANDGTIASGFAFADLIGLEVAYPEMKLNEKLNPLGRRIADNFRTGCTYPNFPALAFVPLSTLFNPGISPYAHPDFQRAFAEQALAAPNAPTPQAKIRMSRCDTNLSPLSVTPVGDLETAAGNYRATGADITTRVMDCLAVGAGDPYEPDLQWLLDQV